MGAGLPQPGEEGGSSQDPGWDQKGSSTVAESPSGSDGEEECEGNDPPLRTARSKQEAAKWATEITIHADERIACEQEAQRDARAPPPFGTDLIPGVERGGIVLSPDLPVWLLHALCDRRPSATILILTHRMRLWGEHVKEKNEVESVGMRTTKRGVLLRDGDPIHLTGMDYIQGGATFVVADISLLSHPTRLEAHDIKATTQLAYPAQPAFRNAYTKHIHGTPHHAMSFDAVRYDSVVVDMTHPLTRLEFSLIQTLSTCIPTCFVWVTHLPAPMMHAAGELIGVRETLPYKEGATEADLAAMYADLTDEEEMLAFAERHVLYFPEDNGPPLPPNKRQRR